MRKFKFALVILGVMVSVTTAQINVGEMAPDFTATDLQGKEFTLSACQDSIVVLFFMGYNCGICKAEAPAVEQNIHQQFKGYGVKVVGVDIWDGSNDALQNLFVDPTNSTYRFLTMSSAVGRQYGMSVSNFVVVGTDGKIKYIKRSYNEDELVATLDILTSTPGSKPKTIPTDFYLAQNYPNPFNPSTRIEFEINNPGTEWVSLTVFDLLGNQVKTLVADNRVNGFYSATWDGTNSQGRNVAAGVYLYQLRVGNEIASRRMMLMR